MIDDLKAHVSDWTSEAQIRSYLEDTLAKRAFDGSGLIYGIGHAVYSLSDPRAEVLRKFAIDISREKGLSDEMELRLIVERVAREMLTARNGRPASSNVDFYSGFLYQMLGLPQELLSLIHI